MPYTMILIAGFGGGAIRGLAGFIKHQFSYKKVEFNLAYFLSMVFLSGVVGLLTAVSIQEAGVDILSVPYLTPGLALVVGYAGGDFLENAYKILVRKN